MKQSTFQYINSSRDEVSVKHRGNNKKWVNNEQRIKDNLQKQALGINKEVGEYDKRNILRIKTKSKSRF
jgi:hypothetical protein